MPGHEPSCVRRNAPASIPAPPGACRALSRRAVDAGAAEAGALNKEREALLAELSASTGLGGRPRVAGSLAERMRKAVTYRIRHAIARVAGAHPELGRHLRASVRTGTWCSYTPEHRVNWQR